METEEEREDRELHSVLSFVTSNNKRIDDEYDVRGARIDAKKKLKEDENQAEQRATKIGLLREKLSEVRARVSEARKLGKDPLIASMKLKLVAPKIKMAEVTGDKRDFEEVERLLLECLFELESAQKEEQLDIKKELEQKLRTEGYIKV